MSIPNLGDYHFNFYDFETNGIDSNNDGITQAALIRTDGAFNIIEGSERNIHVRPRIDQVPSPEAFHVTGIDIDYLVENGMSELEMVNFLHKYFTTSRSDMPLVATGYNNIQFDNKMMRSALFRNLKNPYEWEWKDFNQQNIRNRTFDIYNAVIAAYALRPEILEWPTNEEGLVSTKLEELTIANGIDHGHAHDALSDVYATIGVAKMINERNSGLMRNLFSLRDKHVIKDMMARCMAGGDLIIDIDRIYGKVNKFASVIFPVIADEHMKEKTICIDLRRDPSDILEMNLEELRYHMFTKWDEKTGNPVETPIVSKAANQATVFKNEYDSGKYLLTQKMCDHLELDIDKINHHLDILTRDFNKFQRLRSNLQYLNAPNPSMRAVDTYSSIYTGIHLNKGSAFFHRDDVSKQYKWSSQDLTDPANPVERMATVDVFKEACGARDKLRNFDLLLRAKWIVNRDFPESAEDVSPSEALELKEVLGYLNERYYGNPGKKARTTIDTFHPRNDQLKLEKVFTEAQAEVNARVVKYVDSLEEKFDVLKELVEQLEDKIELAMETHGKEYGIITKLREENLALSKQTEGLEKEDEGLSP